MYKAAIVRPAPLLPLSLCRRMTYTPHTWLSTGHPAVVVSADGKILVSEPSRAFCTATPVVGRLLAEELPPSLEEQEEQRKGKARACVTKGGVQVSPVCCFPRVVSVVYYPVFLCIALATHFTSGTG